MKTFKASNYMRTPVATIGKGATLKEAVRIMIEHKTNGLVVVDADNRVAGILSSWDMIQHLVPDYLEEDQHLAAFEAAAKFKERVTELADDPIERFMTKQVHSIHPESTLMEAAATLSEFRIRQLPVVDDDGYLVGYLNRTDIKKAVAEILGIDPQ
ncbi:hypothetical protein CO174_04045 [Candidatus Uhrbacteria bacterium CG_4_9_14_3_um_filter_50_9]|uniref:CBS domain-containing protein n=1 Tax=Candidatus Uhrbacteria bacterium CG_4_9_14_3_um_filter_50_9 TaxID=1975035 RepID=A0A2M7XBH1_9BACT|nr:MAG: hypothetical protein CO174_04045 [Candidatus Uhrbacteria bacterium CG_4_9_14_3_um_filter_50_9]